MRKILYERKTSKNLFFLQNTPSPSYLYVFISHSLFSIVEVCVCVCVYMYVFFVLILLMSSSNRYVFCISRTCVICLRTCASRWLTSLSSAMCRTRRQIDMQRGIKKILLFQYKQLSKRIKINLFDIWSKRRGGNTLNYILLHMICVCGFVLNE